MKKRLLTFLLCICILGFTIYKLDSIVNIAKKFFNNTPTLSIEKKNQFSKNKDYDFVQISKDYKPYNYQELLNVFYTVLDSGYENFTFYCPSEYLDCIDDVKKISNPENVDILTTIGNFVSPYNNFTSLKVQFDTSGEVTLDIKRLYSSEDIINISNKIDSIWKDIVTQDMSTEDIIYAFHDYIINTTKYDEAYENEIKNGKSTHNSAKANGPLFEGFGICSGYTDVLSIVLDKLGLDNYKVASKTHVWNAVKINNEWKHIDLTWDDPVSIDHSVNNLLHKFYLIDTPTLESFDIKDHSFDKSIYVELK
mgnify:FL=1